MANYWKSKVLPKIKKVFENPKKTAAAETCKAFDESKEEYSKAFEDNKTQLQPKVVEIYEACSAEIKVSKCSTPQKKKKEFPGSKPVSEAATKVGPGNLPGPIFFVFEKVSTFVVTEEKREVVVEAPPPPAVEKTEEETSTSAEVKEKDIVPEEKAPPPPPEVEKVEPPPPPPVAEAERPKVEEVPPAKEP
ncbi:plasma membrane-associated cation-binding protein 1-like [Primulina huaijiensis]|uniref:plasma membrane-associated cation-binding protein 1-like n=1 Tax=Primulina huaijiensis TaxID=1492673 RepID=UPI003CC77563